MSSSYYADFAQAARRHLADASYLYARSSYANADHLAGVAAECGLKAILIEHLGGVLSRGKPAHPTRPDARFSHLPGLWGEIAKSARGRSSTAFLTVMIRPNPFQMWDVAERYSDGRHIDRKRAQHHIDAARLVLGIYQQAKLTGALP